MKTSQKIIALLLALVLILSLAACGKEKPKEEAKTQPNGLYTLSDSGEAIVSDVDFSAYQKTDDNARVFYEIFVGSFSDSDGDGTGDLRGIINRMDYLNDGDPQSGKSLGIEGIWLTPIFTSTTYHKYNVKNYYEIDPKFGTMDDLKELIALCHERGVKLILDLVINHTGTGNEWFQNFVVAIRNGEKNSTWHEFYSYYRESEGSPAGRSFSQLAGTDVFYECNFDGGMPELNYDNPDVRKAVLDVAKYYLDLGIDGFRFDAAKYIYFGDTEKNIEFWNWYIGELKKIKPDIYTVAEVWDSDSMTDKYYEALNCFNFTTSQANGLIAETAKAGDANKFTSYVESYIKRVKGIRSDSMILQFIANHDMDRSAGYLTAATYNLQFAANLYILSSGSPFIYYGEEIGLRGSRGGANTDANRRLAMLWGDDDKVSDPEGTTYNAENQVKETVKDQLAADDSPLTYYKRLLMIRAANPEIARGDYKALKLSGTKVGGFVATWNGSSVCVLHNPSINPQEIDLSTVSGAENFKTISAAIGQGSATLDGSKLTISEHTSVVLR